MRFPTYPRDLFVTVPMTAEQAKQEAQSRLMDASLPTVKIQRALPAGR